MKSLVLASLTAVPLVACYAGDGERRATGQCPAGEICSATTPTGLQFIGNGVSDSLFISGPLPTAIGGTQVIRLEYDRGDGIDVALDMPYVADDDGGAGVRVESTQDSRVTVRGTGSRSNYLRILDLDGTLMDRRQLDGAAVDTLRIVTLDWEGVPDDRSIAFNTGVRRFGVALYGDVQTSSGPQSKRLIDTSMQLSLTGAERVAWDALEMDVTPGTHPLVVTAGDKPPATLDLVVVDHADTVALQAGEETTIDPADGVVLCFEALAAGHYVAGLTWTFDVDGETREQGDMHLLRNCVSVSTTKTTGSVVVQASAGGQSTTVSLAVATAREQRDTSAPARPAPVHIPTAGDRAAM